MNTKVKVKVNADAATASALRSMVQKYADAELATSTGEVQLMAWLLEMSREITLASADRLSLAPSDRGFEMVLAR